MVFNIPNKWDNYLFQILNGIYSGDYVWKIGEEEDVLGNNGYSFFQKKIYDESSFFNKIKEQHYLIFADIRLYKNSGDMDFKISNYSDFLKSDCLLILFITDNEFVDVYCKDEKLIQIIYHNVLQSGFTNVKLTYSDSNTRKVFSPYSD